MRGRRLGAILVALGTTTPEQVDAALERARSTRRPLGEALVELRYAGEETVLRALGVQIGAPLVDLSAAAFDLDVLDLVPEGLALARRILPLAIVPSEQGRDTLIAAVESPRNAGIAEVEFHTGLRVAPVLAPAARLTAALVRAYRLEPTPGHGLFLGNGPGMEHVVERYFEASGA